MGKRPVKRALPYTRPVAPVLEFEHVSKLYRRGVLRPQRITALDDFSLTVEPGEIFGFLGPNGAGKTTAIHIALGFMCATSGAGRLLGRRFGHAATRARVGFLAENVAFYHRPAARLVSFYGALNNVPPAELGARTRAALEAVNLLPDADRNVAKFSRGMLQRVGLAQVLVNDPELLILDEPTSALDPLARVTVRELLLRARERGKTVFLSSHLLSEVETVCDRIAILRAGRLVRVGRTDALLKSREQTVIVARNIAPAQFAGAAMNDGLVSFNVAAAAQRAAIERVWAAGGEIVSVNPARRSLEELFVELTSGVNTA